MLILFCIKLLLEKDKFLNQCFQVKKDWLIILYREHVDAVGIFHRTFFIQPVQKIADIPILFYLDDDAHIAGGFVPDIVDFVKHLIFHQGDKAFHKLCFISCGGIRNLGDDNVLPAAVGRFDFHRGAYFNFALARRVDGFQISGVDDCAARRKIRPRNIFHQFRNGDVGTIHAGDDAVNYLAGIVGGHIGRHADRDAGRAVDQQVRQHGRKHLRLLFVVVEVRDKLDKSLIQIVKQCHCALGKPRLGVAHGGGRIAVDGTEIAVTVDQRDRERIFLWEMHERVVDGGIAVRMVFAHGIADDAGAFSVRFLRFKAELRHGVENAALHRL